MANEKQVAYWNEVAGPKWIKVGDTMEARFAGITDLLLAKAALQPGEHILDVGCGTGPTSLRAADQVGATGYVTGIDISSTMLNVARQHIKPHHNLEFLSADAETYEFSAASFDVLISRFGVMFFGNPTAAFSNLRTALKPGARLCFVCWAPLDDNPHWNVPFQIVSAALGPPAPKPLHAPGPMAFADARYVIDILTNSGFNDVFVNQCSVSIIGQDIESESQIACSLGPSGALLDEKHADQQTRIKLRDLIAKEFATYDQADGPRLPASVFIVTAKNV